MNRYQKSGVIILRVAVAVLLMIHGIARISLGIVRIHPKSNNHENLLRAFADGARPGCL